MKTCVFGSEPKVSDEVPLAPRTEPAETTATWQALKLLFCAAGLQVGRQALLLLLGWVPVGWDSVVPKFSPSQSQQFAGWYVMRPLLPRAHCTAIFLEVVGGNTVFSFLLPSLL